MLNNRMKQTIGAYLQCYKNPYATYKCLESFRKFYPTNTIVLLSDNGYNYEKMAEYFNCIYIHSTESIPFIYENMEEKNRILHGNNIINRISQVFELIIEDYIIWLEDDVCINSEIMDLFRYDLNGFCPNKVSNFWNINDIQQKYSFISKNIDYVFTGHGGSVFHKINMLNYFKNVDIINDILINWKKYNFCSNICQDFLFSMIIHFNNGTIGPYIGHADYRYKNDNIVVQHQYKVFYNIEMPEQLQYLYKTN